MSGLEKIIARIDEDSQKEADAIYKEARDQAASIRSDADRRIFEECEKIKQGTDEQIAAIRERGKARADMSYRQIVLSGKQELIQETISAVRERLEYLSDEEYVAFIRGLLKKHVPSQDAVLYFNARDQKRIPKSVTDGFISDAAKNGSKVTVSEKPALISNGFILDYGGVDENCTFDALIDQNLESLQDQAGAALFGQSERGL